MFLMKKSTKDEEWLVMNQDPEISKQVAALDHPKNNLAYKLNKMKTHKNHSSSTKGKVNRFN